MKKSHIIGIFIILIIFLFTATWYSLAKGKGLLNSNVPAAALGQGTSAGQTEGIFSEGTGSEEINIPLVEITEKAKWYTYDADGIKIRFFAVKANDGSIKTAFDACDVCYRLKKGYRQDGDYMQCNNCGNKYPLTSLGVDNKNPGGCWPGYFPSFVKNEELVIKKADISKGKWRFA